MYLPGRCVFNYESGDLITTFFSEYCEKTDVIKFMEHLFESELLPASLQVENIMTNSDTFSEVFECPVGSTMNNNPSKLQFPHFHTDYANYNYDSSNEL